MEGKGPCNRQTDKWILLLQLGGMFLLPLLYENRLCVLCGSSHAETVVTVVTATNEEGHSANNMEHSNKYPGKSTTSQRGSQIQREQQQHICQRVPLQSADEAGRAAELHNEKYEGTEARHEDGRGEGS